MEEASVAGESPDSSKQRESSEEPTSGSAGPVPEARTEASERRDPRLAVAREDAKRSAGSAGSGSGGIDTATRVLSVRETGPEAEASGEDDAAGADASSDAPVAPERSESPDGSEGGDATPTAGSDGRLRDAVAAWVATADERAAANARLGDAPDAEESSRNGDEDDETEAPEGAGDAPSREAAAPQDTERAEQADGDAADDAGPDAGSASDGAQGSTTAADPDTDAEAGAAPDSGSGTDATPAPDTKPDQEPDADSEPAPDAQAASSRDGDADGDDGPPPVDQPTAVFKAPRPGRPAVDQPTTMLKLGDAASAAKKAGQKSGQKSDGPARSEGDAERTSKFVALRNPDDPANRRPPGTAQSAPAAEAPKAPATEPKGPQAPRTGVTAARSHVGPDRTTQQPLPPKPPLDLLAELTNTPPPPETPLRTTVRRVKIWTPLVILLVIVFGVVQSMRPLPAPTLDLTAQDSFSFDGGKPQIPWPESGQAALDVQGIGSFGSSGDQKPVPIASVAKVMTAYLVLRDHPLKSGAEGPKIKIDQAAEDQSQAGQESTVDVFAGDSISQREALQAILIASANNVARLLARWDAGSEKAFVEKMNGAAKDLGMTNTTYTDPSGLNNTTVSTAVDQVKLAKAAMKEPAFREVAAMMSYNDYKGENHGNWNQLVGHNGVVGIKTGTTTSALGNLVFAAKKEVGGETRTIVGAVVRQPDVGGGILDAALDASDELIRAAQDTLKSSTIIKKGSVVGYVDDGLGGRTPVVASQDVKAVGWGGLTVKLTFTADEVPHTAKAGTKVGTLTVGDGGTSGAVKVPVALGSDLVEPGFTDKLTRLG
ncbi:D-alanyl-D-alanine carboxypeptidase [Streptomyces lividans]|nr:D-alanyl-D-alanine carboxypeptidase [Streptomyces lividans]